MLIITQRVNTPALASAQNCSSVSRRASMLLDEASAIQRRERVGVLGAATRDVDPLSFRESLRRNHECGLMLRHAEQQYFAPRCERPCGGVHPPEIRGTRNGAVPAGHVESARRLRGSLQGGCFNPLRPWRSSSSSPTTCQAHYARRVPGDRYYRGPAAREPQATSRDSPP